MSCPELLFEFSAVKYVAVVSLQQVHQHRVVYRIGNESRRAIGKRKVCTQWMRAGIADCESVDSIAVFVCIGVDSIVTVNNWVRSRRIIEVQAL